MVSGSVTGVAVCRFESCPDYKAASERSKIYVLCVILVR